MATKTTAQKNARKIQRETGKPYSACLQIALAEAAERQAARAASEPEASTSQPSSSGLFSHA